MIVHDEDADGRSHPPTFPGARPPRIPQTLYFAFGAGSGQAGPDERGGEDSGADASRDRRVDPRPEAVSCGTRR
ncbi:hypothetical protein GCM10010191_39150 [Actinomadura vinacea]|uniref:Uncharacterized protein n=1 Tax=Actinomadura vinacea TaxID=115336 RepID=A0ABN3J6Q4_9ACTN